MYKSQGSRLSCLHGWMAARASAPGGRAGRGGGRPETRPTPRRAGPRPVASDASAGTTGLVRIRLADAAQSGAAVPGGPTSVPFQEWSKERSRGDPFRLSGPKASPPRAYGYPPAVRDPRTGPPGARAAPPQLQPNPHFAACAPCLGRQALVLERELVERPPVLGFLS